MKVSGELNKVGLAVVLVSFISQIFLLLRGAYPTLFKDEFYFGDLYKSAVDGNIDFIGLFEPHFGHIIAIPKLLLWLVIHFNLDWRVTMYAQVVISAISLWLLVIICLEKYVLSKRFFLTLSMAFLLCSARQSENLYWAMQVGVPSMVLFTISAFYFTAQFSEKQKTAYALIGLFFGVLAFISFGGGIVSLFITIFAVSIFAKEKYVKAFFVLMGILFLWSLLNSNIVSATKVASLNIDAKNFIIYVLAFFSNALNSYDRGDDALSMLYGALVLISAVFAISSSWKDKKFLLPHLLIIFSLLSCFLIAYARMKNGIWQPNAPRYYPFAAISMIGTMLILSCVKGRLSTYVFFGLFAAITISYTQSYFIEWKTAPFRYKNLEQAHLSLCKGDVGGLAFDGNKKDVNLLDLKNIFCLNQSSSQSGSYSSLK